MALRYIDIVVSGIAALFAVGLAVYHGVVAKPRPTHIILSLISLAVAAALTLLLLLYIPQISLPADTATRWITALACAAAALSFSFTLAYPSVGKNSALLAIAAASIPGFAISGIILLSDMVIASAGGLFDIAPGRYWIACPAALGLYAAGLLIAQIARSLISGDRAFRVEMFFFFAGSLVSLAGAVLSVLFIPPGAYEFASPESGVILSLMLYLGSAHYAADNIETLDFRDFYLTVLYWLLILVMLLLPVALYLMYQNFLFGANRLPAPANAVIIFLYLFIVFRYMRVWLERLFQRRHLDFAERVNRSFISLSEIEDSGESFSWDEFFRTTADRLIHTFDIDRAELLIIDRGSGGFRKVYISDSVTEDTGITPDSEFIECLTAAGSTVITSQLFTNEALKKYREPVLAVFRRGSYGMAMPFFDQKKAITGLLLLGRMKKAKSYSYYHLAPFELYRIQFQQQLQNALTLDEAKERQAIEHDRMVVNAIKKTTIPERMLQIEGIRISSMYISNSEYGCDYYDSIVLEDGRLSLFLSNSSYSGIDSSITALQLFSALHTPSKYYSSPDRILNLMNWILTTSGTAPKPVPSLALIYSRNRELQYSSAAASPLLLYNPRDGIFSVYETRGEPLGIRQDAVYESGSIRPAPGSIGLICSNGLFASINAGGEAYPVDSVKGIIAGSHGEDPAVILRRIHEDYTKFIGGRAQINDVTLILFKV
ncbi:MAG: SpoIIE family protein phosphatase [Spirochaetes bacterium]|nr:SpoIIE family protein phosphatase [Spirochaetota bacterium]